MIQCSFPTFAVEMEPLGGGGGEGRSDRSIISRLKLRKLTQKSQPQHHLNAPLVNRAKPQSRRESSRAPRDSGWQKKKFLKWFPNAVCASVVTTVVHD